MPFKIVGTFDVAQSTFSSKLNIFNGMNMKNEKNNTSKIKGFKKGINSIEE